MATKHTRFPKRGSSHWDSVWGGRGSNHRRFRGGLNLPTVVGGKGNHGLGEVGFGRGQYQKTLGIWGDALRRRQNKFTSIGKGQMRIRGIRAHEAVWGSGTYVASRDDLSEKGAETSLEKK